MLPIYVSTACLPGEEPVWDRLLRYAEYGLLMVELGGGVSVEREELVALPGFIGRLLIHNYFPPPDEEFVFNLASQSGDIRQRSLNLAYRALDLCARVGAPFYSFHGGFITDPVGHEKNGFIFPLPESSTEKAHAMARFVAELESILDYANSLGVGILVENNVCSADSVDRLLFVEAIDFIELIQALPDPGLGILLDTGHLSVSATTLAFDRLDYIDQISPYVRALHVHDNDGSSDQHLSLKYDSWVLDVLCRPEIAGLPIVIESKFDSVETLEQHVQWMSTHTGSG